MFKVFRKNQKAATLPKETRNICLLFIMHKKRMCDMIGHDKEKDFFVKN